MRRALELARMGVALASPNPHVGAVLVDEARDEVVGTGTYSYDGVAHAEVLALERAGERARGATLYINLEPCCHTGRTAPCADAVIAAGIRRVVAAMPDPNPLVSGGGFERLRAAGVQLETGLLEDQARKLNEGFAKYIRHRTPLVTLKSAMTLDGKIAAPSAGSGNPSALGAGGASSTYITSEAARAHVHELRHASDAILVGLGTIVADDPLLTDRTGRPRRRPLLRVILDSRLRLPLHSRLVQTAHKDVLVFCASADDNKKRELEARGIQVEQVRLKEARDITGAPAPEVRPNMQEIARRLGEREITSLLVEGGSAVNWAALNSGVVDKVFLYYAPRILGSSGSVPFAAGAGYRHMAEAAHVRNITLHRFGEDFAVEGYLKDVYSD